MRSSEIPVVVRRVNAFVCAIAVGAVVLQLVLVLLGHAPLAPELRPERPEAVRRFLSYFTIQSNILVAVTTYFLAVGRGTRTRGWAVARIAAIVGITVTALVHLTLLRPILHLEGIDAWADELLHVVVPVAALLSWAVLGPHDRATFADAWWSLAWPLAWLAATLALGPVTGWYPYPFLDPATNWAGGVVVMCLAIGALFVVLALATVALDRRLAYRATTPRR